MSICSFGENFREIKPVDIVVQSSAENKDNVIMDGVNVEYIPTRDKNILDLEQKKIKDDIIYKMGDNTPYTGSFGLFLGDFMEYKEDYVNGVLNGDKTWYNDAGKIVLQEHYKNGKIYGYQKSYYGNGDIKSIIKYDKNRIMEITDFNPQGDKIYHEVFKNGNGTFKIFWENGNLAEIGSYKKWQKTGKWKKYRKNGELDTVINYKNGRVISEYWTN